MLGRDQHAPRARRQRVGGEPAAVHALADEAGEQVAGSIARVSIDGARPARASARRRRRAPAPRGRRRPAAARPTTIMRRHFARSPRARPASRRTAPCGRSRTPGPARGPCRRSRRRRRAAPARSRGRSTPAGRRRARPRACGEAGMPATISSMIASGGSERGLSDVISATSASRAAISPMIGRLPRSRSPPAPTTTISRPRRQLARRQQHLLERVRLVRVVDDDAERLARLDRLEAARSGGGGRQRRGQPVGRRPQRPRRRPRAPAR